MLKKSGKSLYVVGYDTHSRRTADAVADKLRSLDAVRLAGSLWLVSSAKTTAQLRDEVQTSVEYNDALVVVEVKPGAHWASRNATDAGLDWMKRHLSM